MRRRAHTLAAVIVAGLAAVVAVPGALAGQEMPGVTARTVTIGGTFSLTGVASGYAPIFDRHAGVLQLRQRLIASRSFIAR
jgi:hypothetical protein